MIIFQYGKKEEETYFLHLIKTETNSIEGAYVNSVSLVDLLCINTKLNSVRQETAFSFIPSAFLGGNKVALQLESSSVYHSPLAEDLVEVNITDWVDYLIQATRSGNKEEAYKTFREAFKEGYNSSVVEDLAINLEAYILPYLTSNFNPKIRLPITSYGHLTNIKKMIDNHNVSATDSYGKDETIVGARQNIETERITLRLPKISLLNKGIDESDFTNLSQIFTPYPNPIFKTPLWAEFQDMTPNNITPAEIGKSLNSLVNRTEAHGITIYTEEEKQQIKQYTKTDPLLIIGNPENDQLPIQENEKDLYLALCKFMEDWLRHSYPDTFQEMYDTATMSRTMEQTLKKYFWLILRHNWSAVGATSLDDLDIEMDVDNDSFDETLEKNSEDGYLSHEVNYTDENGVTHRIGEQIAITPVFSFVKNVATGYTSLKEAKGCDVIAEAIVKLLRWGDRRIRTLIIGDDNKRLNMLNFTREAITIDFETLEKVKFGDEEQYDSILENTFYLDASTKQHGHILSILGFTYIRKYISEDGTRIDRVFAITIPEYIRRFREGNAPKLLGIEYLEESNEFICPRDIDPISLADVKKGITEGRITLENSDELTSIGKVYSIDNKKISPIISLNSNEVLNHAALAITDRTQLAEYCKNQAVLPTQVVCILVAQRELAIINEIASEDMEELLNNCNEICDKFPSLLPLIEKKVEQKATVFDQSKVKEDEKNQEEEEVTIVDTIKEVTGPLHIQVPPEKGANFYQLDLTDGIQDLIYIHVRIDVQTKRMLGIYFSVMEDLVKIEANIQKAKYPVGNMVLLLINAIVKAENNKVEKIPIYITSKKVLENNKKR